MPLGDSCFLDKSEAGATVEKLGDFIRALLMQTLLYFLHRLHHYSLV